MADDAVRPNAPAFILSADHHAFIGPTLRSLGHRLAFEERTNSREPGTRGTSEEFLQAADEIDDWREAHGLETTRGGALKFPDQESARVDQTDGPGIIHYAAKILIENRGGTFTLSEGDPASEASHLAIREVEIILAAANRARRK